jgi:predicted flap endonuclease-1-like 5' DNA nuclease
MRGVGYAAWEIAVLLVVALVVGVVVGWILRRVLYDTRVEGLEVRAAAAEHRMMLVAAELARIRATAGGPGGDTADEATALGAVAEIAARTAGTHPAPSDDLTVVRGIGPAIERTLKGMGITSLHQIASLTPADVATVTAALGAFPGRIERDRWMESAAAEHRKKYGSEE